jgi:hypothetical protein
MDGDKIYRGVGQMVLLWANNLNILMRPHFVLTVPRDYCETAPEQ